MSIGCETMWCSGWRCLKIDVTQIEKQRGCCPFSGDHRGECSAAAVGVNWRNVGLGDHISCSTLDPACSVEFIPGCWSFLFSCFHDRSIRNPSGSLWVCFLFTRKIQVWQLASFLCKPFPLSLPFFGGKIIYFSILLTPFCVFHLQRGILFRLAEQTHLK